MFAVGPLAQGAAFAADMLFKRRKEAVPKLVLGNGTLFRPGCPACFRRFGAARDFDSVANPITLDGSFGSNPGYFRQKWTKP